MRGKVKYYFMERKNLFDNIEQKLTYLNARISNRSSLNLLELNIHAEVFYANLFNLIFDLHLEDVNNKKHNVASVDLQDNKNKIIVQVTSNATKNKINQTLSKRILSNYSGYKLWFIFLTLNDVEKLCNGKYINPYNIEFNPSKDIYDLKRILSCIMSLTIDKLQEVNDFINKEIKWSIEKDKFDSDLTKVIIALSKEELAEIAPPNKLPFQVEEKIQFNNLMAKYNFIKDFDAYLGILSKKYKEFDKLGKNSSFVILNSLKIEYRNLQTKYSDSIKVFDKLIRNTKTKVRNSNNAYDISEEMLEFCVCIIVVDAFFKCKIFENPEEYKNATT